MPNAGDIQPKDLRHNILLLGYTGSGKTAQILTLPGKTFCYFFDPSSIHTLAGHDYIDYEMFVPSQLNIAAQSLKKGKGDAPTKVTDAENVYGDFAEHLEGAVESGFFEQYDNIVLDSFTTFSDIVMDRVMYINDRLGQQPQQDDWSAQMVTIKSVVRELIGQNIRIVCTGHIEFKQDETTGRSFNIIRLTGQLRTLLPLLFSDILLCDVETKGADQNYVIKTKKDKQNPQLRCTLRSVEGKTLPPMLSVDIPDEAWKDPRGKYGLGSLIAKNQSES